MPLAAYYFIFNEACVALVTCALHYNWLGEGDIASVLDAIGASKYIDIKKTMDASVSLGPIQISAKLATNFTIASAFMSLWTPLQIPFCIATLPYIRKLFRFRKPQ
jgi:hypothetical protein